MEQKIYDIAEWLVYNYESVKAILKSDLDRWVAARNELADTSASRMQYNVEIHNKYKDAVARMVSEHHKIFDSMDVSVAFEDERVLIILDRYYMKDLYEN